MILECASKVVGNAIKIIDYEIKIVGNEIKINLEVEAIKVV